MYMLEICCVIICSEWRTVLNMNTHRHALIYVYISHFQKCTTACHIQWHNSFMNSIHIICFWGFFLCFLHNAAAIYIIYTLDAIFFLSLRMVTGCKWCNPFSKCNNVQDIKILYPKRKDSMNVPKEKNVLHIVSVWNICTCCYSYWLLRITYY